MALTAKQRQILVDNFTSEQSENLIPIVELMQEPSSFKKACSQLKTLEIYDIFVAFLRKHTWHLYMKDEFMLKYSVMEELELRNGVKCFSKIEDEYIAHIMEAPNWLHPSLNDEVNKFKPKHCNIILPLFSKRLNIYSLLSIETPINILNIDKVDYPITLDCCMRNLKTIPYYICGATLEVEGKRDIKKLLKSKSQNLTDLIIEFSKSFSKSLDFRVTLGDALLSFPNLQSLTISDVGHIEDDIRVPNSVKSLNVRIWGMWQNLSATIEKLIYTLPSNPSIKFLRVNIEDVIPSHTVTDIDKSCASRLITECNKLGFNLVDNHHIGDLCFYRES